MHTAQLELTQANLQREKETALVELRDMLNGRHAQELALAQSRQQLVLEQAREQHAREREELARRCGQETGTRTLGDGGSMSLCFALCWEWGLLHAMPAPVRSLGTLGGPSVP